MPSLGKLSSVEVHMLDCTTHAAVSHEPNNVLKMCALLPPIGAVLGQQPSKGHRARPHLALRQHQGAVATRGSATVETPQSMRQLLGQLRLCR
jgi:hypothetical protein